MHTDVCEGPSGASIARRTLGWHTRLLLIGVSLSVLGLGERVHVDERFSTPAAAVVTYWEALRSENVDAVWECLLDSNSRLPFPGMLWFLPPTTELTVDSLRCLKVNDSHVIATYELRYRPQGMRDEQSLPVATEVVRVRGQWRIAQPLAEDGVLDWVPIPRQVDI